MKKILFCAALTVATSSSLLAQKIPNREGLGEDPKPAAAADKDGSAPAASESPEGKDKDKDGDKASGKTPDERFIHKAGKAGMMEVKVAEMGVSKASSAELKEFSAMLVKDHSAANMELMAIAKTLGVDIPAPHADKDKDHKSDGHAAAQSEPSGRKDAAPVKESKKALMEAKHRELEESTGAEFDKAYAAIMEECHAADIALFEKAEGKVESAELKGFITKTLPVIKKHAEALKAISKK